MNQDRLIKLLLLSKPVPFLLFSRNIFRIKHLVEVMDTIKCHKSHLKFFKLMDIFEDWVLIVSHLMLF